MSRMPRKTVIVNDERTRYTVTLTHVDEVTDDVCGKCGAELWTRDGEGRYVLLMLLDGAPLLQPHYSALCMVTL